MALETYKQKRNFKKSPEPTGGTPNDKHLRFVIQKHHASHLHYDFRLELRGVLKSWAVPKGLSMDPTEKRLAMLVEDHPWDYRNFEGIIPSGYGAGTVIVWDEGTYTTTEIKEKDKKSQEHSITSQFWKGSIKFTLHGHKVKGDFIISRAKNKGENAWYILKAKDKFATTTDITKKDKSVISGKTLEQVEAAPEREWQSHKPAYKQTPAAEDDNHNIDALVKSGEKSAMPSTIQPMLCTLIKEPFNNADWLYEVKWDGYRIIAFIKKGKVRLQSRGGQNYTDKYAAISTALEGISADAVIDGELVVVDEKGLPDFAGIQNYKEGNKIIFYVFDLLWCQGYNLQSLPLTDRRDTLRQLIPESDAIKYSDSFDDGNDLFESAKKMGIEGIIAKKRDSIYTPGRKGNTWYKCKLSLRQEYVIGGWTESDNNRLFKSLVFGHYVAGKLTYVHHSGGGYTDAQIKELAPLLKKLEVKKSPFVNEVPIKAKLHWLKPELVAEFNKSDLTTKKGTIRHPAIFLGLRKDKKPTDVIEEKPIQAVEESPDAVEPGTSAVKEKTVRAAKTKKAEAVSKKTSHVKHEADQGSWEMLDDRTITSTNELVIEKHKLELVNIERELWPGVTKADLIQYYISISDYILPHLADRPLGLNINLASAARGGFFLRGMEGHAPAWAEVFTTERKHKKKGKSDTIEWLVCNNLPTLVYIINLESVDIHPWTSRIQTPDNPDFIVIDLDPSDDDFKKVITTALAAKKVFTKLKLKTFVKTSGKTGLHILIPCVDIAFGEARQIAEQLCVLVHKQVPEITTVNVSVSSRGELLYVDPNQNDYADRLAVAYCVRSYHLPTVSTPLDWKEVCLNLNPHEFTIHNIAARLKKKGDLFKGILEMKMRKGNAKVLKDML